MQQRVLYKTVILMMLLFYFPVSEAADKKVIGWLEKVHIDDANMVIRAKIDTGADNSSIKAEILKKFDRQGEEWIRFRIMNKDGDSAELEKKVERYAEIQRKKAEPIYRPVVIMGLCIGKTLQKVEVNLADRKNFKYHMLIGRSYLRGHFVVDSDLEYQTSPACAMPVVK